MSNFCLIAFIPSIILVIWLFIEIRKYAIVSKNYKSAKISWKKLEKQKSSYYPEEDMVDSIPSSHSYRRRPGPNRPRRKSDFLDYEIDNDYDHSRRPSYDYGYERSYDGDNLPPKRRGSRGYEPLNEAHDSYPEYNDYYSSPSDQMDYGREVDQRLKRKPRNKSRKRLERPSRKKRYGRGSVKNKKIRSKKSISQKQKVKQHIDDSEPIDWD